MNTELNQEIRDKVDEQIAHDVSLRLQGLKQYTLHSRETVYYARDVWARDAEHAREIADSEGDWGDACDYADFEVYATEEA